MSTNRYFSFSRLGLVMKRDLMENWKTNLYRFLGPYAGFLIAMLGCYMVDSDYESFAAVVLSAFTLVLFFGSAYNASIIMENMSTPQQRVSYLMLPATSLEKFVSRALYVTFGFFLMLIIALLLAEATRFLFLPLFHLPEEYHRSILPFVTEKLTTVEVMKFVGKGAEESVHIGYLGMIINWLAILLGHSFFILGGCYWQKHPFWKTVGVIILVTNLLTLFSILLLQSLGDIDWCIVEAWLDANLKWIHVEGIMTFVIVWMALHLVFNWWLSYKLFTRSQVIQPKFRLL